jgi:uncharacterized damage-inducible protein DinB
MDLLDRMLGHDRWATAQLLDLSRGLTDAQLDQEFDIGRRSLRETFNHMITTVNFWTRRMSGEPAMPDRDSRCPIAELIELHERYHAAFATLARRVHDDGRLDETFNDHYGYSQSLGATVIQVMHHNAQHRSEVRHMLVRLDVPGLRGDLDPQEWEWATGIQSQSSQPVGHAVEGGAA